MLIKTSTHLKTNRRTLKIVFELWIKYLKGLSYKSEIIAEYVLDLCRRKNIILILTPLIICNNIGTGLK